jgi:hypothetical protein
MARNAAARLLWDDLKRVIGRECDQPSKLLSAIDMHDVSATARHVLLTPELLYLPECLTQEVIRTQGVTHADARRRVLPLSAAIHTRCQLRYQNPWDAADAQARKVRRTLTSCPPVLPSQTVSHD